jgi:hypothetical protein
LMCCDTAPGVTLNSSAAWANPPSRAAASNARREFSGGPLGRGGAIDIS